eukprot:2649584-Alexandrium_andersonii.AAC.1
MLAAPSATEAALASATVIEDFRRATAEAAEIACPETPPPRARAGEASELIRSSPGRRSRTTTRRPTPA